MKVTVLRMCFCVLKLAKRYLEDAQFEAILKSLCEEVKIGIMNVILSGHYAWNLKRDHVLGLGIDVTEELKVCSAV